MLGACELMFFAASEHPCAARVRRVLRRDDSVLANLAASRVVSSDYGVSVPVLELLHLPRVPASQLLVVPCYP